MRGQPMLGNLAWAPLPAFEAVEVLDRFNGVPTLGTFGSPGEKTLFWRVLGYVPPKGFSVWLYVPLEAEDEQHLEDAEPAELLHGLVFETTQYRRAIVGCARDYRLFGEFEWSIPVGASSDRLVRELLTFLASSLDGLAEQETVTHARWETVLQASEAVRQFAVC